MFWLHSTISRLKDGTIILARCAEMSRALTNEINSMILWWPNFKVSPYFNIFLTFFVSEKQKIIFFITPDSTNPSKPSNFRKTIKLKRQVIQKNLYAILPSASEILCSKQEQEEKQFSRLRSTPLQLHYYFMSVLTESSWLKLLPMPVNYFLVPLKGTLRG